MGQRVLDIITRGTMGSDIEPMHDDRGVLKGVIAAIRNRRQKKKIKVEVVEIAEIAEEEEEDIFAEAGVDYKLTEEEELAAPYPVSDSENEGVTAPYPVSESDSEPEDIDLFATARTRFKEETTELLQQQQQQQPQQKSEKKKHDNTWQKTRHIMQTKYNIDINET